MSDEKLIGSKLMTSGAMNSGVPNNILVDSPTFSSLAKPKSITFIWRDCFVLQRMFSGWNNHTYINITSYVKLFCKNFTRKGSVEGVMEIPSYFMKKIAFKNEP